MNIEKVRAGTFCPLPSSPPRPNRFNRINTYFNSFYSKIQNSVEASGSYAGFSASLKVDIGKVEESIKSGAKFGSDSVELKSGGPDLPEPIGLKLVPIYETFDAYFYSFPDQQPSPPCAHSQQFLETRKAHVKKLFDEYPQLKGVSEAVGKILSILNECDKESNLTARTLITPLI